MYPPTESAQRDHQLAPKFKPAEQPLQLDAKWWPPKSHTQLIDRQNEFQTDASTLRVRLSCHVRNFGVCTVYVLIADGLSFCFQLQRQRHLSCTKGFPRRPSPHILAAAVRLSVWLEGQEKYLFGGKWFRPIGVIGPHHTTSTSVLPWNTSRKSTLNQIESMTWNMTKLLGSTSSACPIRIQSHMDLPINAINDAL